MQLHDRHTPLPRSRLLLLTLVLLVALALAACDGPDGTGAGGDPGRGTGAPEPDADPGGSTDADPDGSTDGDASDTAPDTDDGPTGTVTLGFAGDVHFELHLATLPERGPRAFGRMRPVLRAPDVMMLNLETAITTRGEPEPKQYTFRAAPAVLTVLADLGVDVVTMANNHGADYGTAGLRETFAAIRDSPLPVVGVGEDAAAAFAPYRTSVGGTDLAFFGVSTRPEHTARNFAARRDRAGVAVTIEPHRRLLSAVREAEAAGEVVVVYLHWGQQLRPCPSPRQQRHARALADAGADVVVGTHAHVLQGSGWLGETYVTYGLADFVWYHDYRPETGVLTLTVEDGAVTAHDFTPALIQPNGIPLPRRGQARQRALREWHALRGCTELSDSPPGA